MLRVTFVFFLLLCGCGDKAPPAPGKLVTPAVEPPDEPPPGTIEKPSTVDFRILVNRKKNPEVVEAALQSFEDTGPDKAVAPGVRWFPIWGIAYFAYSGTSIEMAQRNPEQFLNDIMGLVAAVREGEVYVLTWDTPDKAIKAEEGNWAVTEAFVFVRHSPEKYLPPDSLVFSLDKQGARRLGEMTSKNIGQSMTIVVEGKLVMASKIDRRLDRSGVITGGSRTFTEGELDWLRRKMLNLPDPPVKEPAEPIEDKKTPEKDKEPDKEKDKAP